MSIKALNCKDCGGSIAAPAGKTGVVCLFCGSTQIDVIALDQQFEQPDSVIPFQIDQVKAAVAFKEFARSKFWAPNDIKNAKLELSQLYLPAWVWSGEVESHYTGLRSDISTLSGKRPFSGQLTGRIEQALVPASTGITLGELNSIRPFETETSMPWSNETLDAPYEIGQLTREAAIQEGMKVMKRRHTQIIQRQEGTTSLKNSSIITEFDGKSALLPIYVGVYRYKDQPFRIIVNGLNSNTTGDYPLSWLKIMIFVGSLIGFVALIIAFIANG